MQYECYPVDARLRRRRRPAGGASAGTGVRARRPGARAWSGPEADRVYPDGRHAATAGGAQPLAVLVPGRRHVGAVRLLHDVAPAPGSSTRARCAGAARWSTGASARWAPTTQRFTRTVTGTIITRVRPGTGRSTAPGARQRRRVRPLSGEHGRGELRQCGSDSAMMSRMGMPRLRAAAARRWRCGGPGSRRPARRAPPPRRHRRPPEAAAPEGPDRDRRRAPRRAHPDRRRGRGRRRALGLRGRRRSSASTRARSSSEPSSPSPARPARDGGG